MQKKILTGDQRPPRFCQLENLPEDEIVSYGGKAVSLGKLLRSGISIPRGYVLSSEIYSAYLDYNHFPFTCVDYLAKNEEISDWILQGEFPMEVKMNLKKIHQQICSKREQTFVVRSSSPQEDQQKHSMAGIFESYIQLTTYEELEWAIKKCYASLFSDQALSFMDEHNIDLSELRMAVIIQQFVMGQPSGVVFTADTIGMDESQIVISAVGGICSDYVKGKLPSSFYKVNKETGQVVTENVDQKDSLLLDVQIARIHETVIEIEKLLGGYQDIEWTISRAELVILQARPITTFQSLDLEISWSVPDEEQTWSLFDLNPLQPLLQDILFKRVGGKKKGAEITGKNLSRYRIQNGYPYFYMLPGDKEKRKVFRKNCEELSDQGDNIFQDQVLSLVLADRQRLDGYVGKELSTAEAIIFFEKALEYAVNIEQYHWMAVDGNLYLKRFEEYCNEEGFELDSNSFFDLIFQVSWLSIERGKIIQMASFVYSQPDLYSLFEQSLYDNILLAHLRNHPKGRKLLMQIDEYLKDFGLFPVQGQWNLSDKLLLEKPAAVLSKIRVCLDVDLDSYQINTQRAFENKKKLIQSITAEMELEKRNDFLIRLKAAEKSFLVNDDHCYYLDMTGVSYLRLAIMEIGRILVQKSILNRPEDLFFLHLDELKKLVFEKKVDRAYKIDLQTEESMNNYIRERVYETIQERRNIFLQQNQLVPPKTLGKNDTNSREERLPKVSKGSKIEYQKTDSHLTVLQGISGFRKKIKGRVKVIKNNCSSSEIALSEDRILVLKHGHGCYFLPLLNRIKGLIYDQGSPFDHPGIIAREMEIPSIYQTKIATEVLNDGDEVELDGVNEQVIIL